MRIEEFIYSVWNLYSNDSKNMTFCDKKDYKR